MWAILTPTSCESRLLFNQCLDREVPTGTPRSHDVVFEVAGFPRCFMSVTTALTHTHTRFFCLIPPAAWEKMIDWADIEGVFPVWSSSFTAPYTHLYWTDLFSVNVLMTCRRKQWLYCVFNLVLEFYASLTAFPSDLLTWVNFKITIDSRGCH